MQLNSGMPFRLQLLVLVFPLALGMTCARAVCHFDFTIGKEGSWWKLGVLEGTEERSDQGDQLHWSWMPYSVTDVGLAGHWTAVCLSDIIWSGKWSDNNNKVSFVMMGPYRLINQLYFAPNEPMIYQLMPVFSLDLKIVDSLFLVLFWHGCKSACADSSATCKDPDGVKEVKQTHGCHQNLHLIFPVNHILSQMHNILIKFEVRTVVWHMYLLWTYIFNTHTQIKAVCVTTMLFVCLQSCCVI